MFPEISLHILDLIQNSIRAHATQIFVQVNFQTSPGTLTVTIEDNGDGMTKEELTHITDPFYTTRTTRRVGLGIPFYKEAALMTGGVFYITSEKGSGTQITARFQTSHIDCMPLGDITRTIYDMILTNESIDFIYEYSKDDRSFSLDTRVLRKILIDIPFTNPEISKFIKEYLTQNKLEIDS